MKPTTVAIIAAALLGPACAQNNGNEKIATPAGETGTAATVPDEETMATLQGVCPMAGADVSVAASDTDGGAALTFTTPHGGGVEDLRYRARHMAAMYQAHRGGGQMHWHHMGGQGMHGRGPMMNGQGQQKGGLGPMPPVDVRVEDLDNGARVILTPTNPADLEALRQRTRMHAERMQSGQCWMLEGAFPEEPGRG